LLSHSSGLGDDLLFKNKHIVFKPCTDFLYSVLGAEYARETIERVTKKSLEEIAQEMVFNPLGMSNSSFVNETSVMTHMANGHMRYLLRANPATLDGSASTGKFLISDSDKGGGENPTDSGASHDVITPSFSTAGADKV
jgi:CubicO group peptidase (beta-lactamase class C family)